jgi:acylphosphatase
LARRAVRLMVEGRVQGVGFRWWTVGEARALGLDGWVRNLRDGRVEVLAIGEDRALDRLTAALAAGSPGARVSMVQPEDADADGSKGFEQKPTAQV